MKRFKFSYVHQLFQTYDNKTSYLIEEKYKILSSEIHVYPNNGDFKSCKLTSNDLGVEYLLVNIYKTHYSGTFRF